MGQEQSQKDMQQTSSKQYQPWSEELPQDKPSSQIENESQSLQQVQRQKTCEEPELSYQCKTTIEQSKTKSQPTLFKHNSLDQQNQKIPQMNNQNKEYQQNEKKQQVLKIHSIDGSGDEIIVTSFHFSCLCDKVIQGTQYAGLVIYDLGKVKTKIRWKPGYIVIKDASKLNVQAHEGKVHGKICKWLFGFEPSQIIKQGGLLCGFSVDQNLNLRFNSLACNTVSKKWQDNHRQMSLNEQKILENAYWNWMILKDCIAINSSLKIQTFDISVLVGYQMKKQEYFQFQNNMQRGNVQIQKYNS